MSHNSYYRTHGGGAGGLEAVRRQLGSYKSRPVAAGSRAASLFDAVDVPLAAAQRPRTLSYRLARISQEG